MARLGIPGIIATDGGLQFSCGAIRVLSPKWVFTHKMSSPGHSKSNDAAEAAAKTEM